MMDVQRRIPLLDQVAFLVKARLLSGWCGVRHHMRNASLQSFVPPIMTGDACLQVLGLSEVERDEVAIGELFHERVVAASRRSDGGRGAPRPRPADFGGRRAPDHDLERAAGGAHPYAVLSDDGGGDHRALLVLLGALPGLPDYDVD
jgi:hypothetical protein